MNERMDALFQWVADWQNWSNMARGVGRSWKVGGGGGNILDYVLLVVLYTSRGVWGHAPQKMFWYFCSVS